MEAQKALALLFIDYQTRRANVPEKELSTEGGFKHREIPFIAKRSSKCKLNSIFSCLFRCRCVVRSMFCDTTHPTSTLTFSYGLLVIDSVLDDGSLRKSLGQSEIFALESTRPKVYDGGSVKETTLEFCAGAMYLLYYYE